MSDPIDDSASLSALVAFKGAAMTCDDIDAYSKYQAVENHGEKVKSVLEAWTIQEDHYRTARVKYADYVFHAFIFQSMVINAAFFLIGFGVIIVDKWVANSFILGVFGEMTGLALIVFKYFFPSSPSRMGDLVEKL